MCLRQIDGANEALQKCRKKKCRKFYQDEKNQSNKCHIHIPAEQRMFTSISRLQLCRIEIQCLMQREKKLISAVKNQQKLFNPIQPFCRPFYNCISSPFVSTRRVIIVRRGTSHICTNSAMSMLVVESMENKQLFACHDKTQTYDYG